MLYDLTFNDTDLLSLQSLLDDLFCKNDILFERLVSALSRIGLRVTIQSTIQLFPQWEVVKKEVVKTLKKGMAHVQKN